MLNDIIKETQEKAREDMIKNPELQDTPFNWVDSLITSTAQAAHEAGKKEERDRIADFIPLMRECASGCGCRYESAGHDGPCVWQPKEYYEAHELEPLFKILTTTVTPPCLTTLNK